MKKITMLFAVGAAMMLLIASVAAAQEGDCTFSPMDHATTCVTTSDGPPIESTQPCELNQGGQRSGEQTVSQPTKIVTTTVYQGQGTTIIDGPTSSEIPGGEPTLGQCKNVPGPQLR